MNPKHLSNLNELDDLQALDQVASCEFDRRCLISMLVMLFSPDYNYFDLKAHRQLASQDVSENVLIAIEETYPCLRD